MNGKQFHHQLSRLQNDPIFQDPSSFLIHLFSEYCYHSGWLDNIEHSIYLLYQDIYIDWKRKVTFGSIDLIGDQGRDDVAMTLLDLIIFHASYLGQWSHWPENDSNPSLISPLEWMELHGYSSYEWCSQQYDSTEVDRYIASWHKVTLFAISYEKHQNSFLNNKFS